MKRYILLITALAMMLLGFVGCNEDGTPIAGVALDGTGTVELTINITRETSVRSALAINPADEELLFENLYLIVNVLNEDGDVAAGLRDAPLSDYITEDIFTDGGTTTQLLENVPAGTWDLEFAIVSREEGMDDSLVHSQNETVTIEADVQTPVTINLTLASSSTVIIPSTTMTLNLTNIPTGVTGIKIYSQIIGSKDISALTYPDISDGTVDWLVDYVKEGTAENYSITADMLPASEDPGTISYVTVQAIHNNGIKDMVLFQGRGAVTAVATNSSTIPYVLDVLGFEFAYAGTNMPIKSVELSITVEGSEYKAHSNDVGPEYSNMVQIPYDQGDFYMDVTEVTIGDFNYMMSLYYPQFLPRDDNDGENSKKPIVNMTLFDAMLYCNAKSMYYGLEPVYSYEVSPTSPRWENGECTMLDYTEISANGYRIPIKDEWVAALGDFDGFTTIEEFAHVNEGDAPDASYMNVGSLLPNMFGIYDMIGNARELVYYGEGVPTNFHSAGWSIHSEQNDSWFLTELSTAPYEGISKENIFFYYYIGSNYKETYTGFRCVTTAQ